ncbi:MAG: RidA family protein [Lachnospiraceae bacterium]|nr:RidA family protein [Lachnospiraceae bacterium]
MRFVEGLTSKGGHYSPGVIAGGMLYISGQLPIDPGTGKIAEGGIREQTKQALANVGRVLEAAGCCREDVVMCRVYISDMGNWDAVNEVYAEFFGAHKPARAVVPTRELHHGALVEIEATAVMKE